MVRRERRGGRGVRADGIFNSSESWGQALFRRLLLIALLVEVGLLLVLIPWSRFWERNYFGLLVPSLQVVITNNFVRGAVSGLGLVNLWLALVELGEAVTERSREDASPAGSG